MEWTDVCGVRCWLNGVVDGGRKERAVTWYPRQTISSGLGLYFSNEEARKGSKIEYESFISIRACLGRRFSKS